VDDLETQILARIEEVVRDNERLKQEVADLEKANAKLSLGVGHVSRLVELAATVRLWREDGKDETRNMIFYQVDKYDEARGLPPSHLRSV
jgi:hypothetical protein